MAICSYPPKPRPGDRVAVISPSFGAPAAFPAIYELGLRRLRDELGLEPVEYPTTRASSAGARDRARDVSAAFADSTVTAVLATIGGHDLITVTPFIDSAAVAANPKPFFGFSDNTNLLNHLYGLGVVAYHGGSVMVHLGRPGGLHPVTVESTRAALFTSDWFELRPSPDYSDEPGDWNDARTLEDTPRMFPSAGWQWQGPATVVEGPTWGGNLEIISWLLQAGRVGPSVDYAGCVLVIETSQELPPDVEVYRILRNMGERGLLAGFPAVLVGRAKAWHFDRRLSPDEKRAYADGQRAAVTRALAEYNPDTVVVFDLDIGHTDPQQIIPYGGTVRVDAVERRITVRY
jgi:muramoyltetrapeptide carboxypeptidase LdcA involved in peptidoglycan recycling